MVTPAHDAGAFTVNIHEAITSAGLSPPGQNLSFLRQAVFEDIADQHEQLDSGLSGGRDERHFDDCEFDGAAEYIRDRYADARAALSASRPWDATDEFGSVLHPAMDVYAHSTWVEMGFPISDDRATAAVEVMQSDLIDLSGAQSSLAQPWNVPAGGVVRRDSRAGDIVLGNDDWTIPVGWSIVLDGRDPHVPRLRDRERETRGRVLMTGRGFQDNECAVDFFVGPGEERSIAFGGFSHDELNKDSPTGPNGPDAHAKARALATLQTGYEWCRLVREAGLVGRAGLLLALWVRAGGNPHPAGTPCAGARPGPTPVVVTVRSVRVLDSGDDDDNDPGEIQLAVALYDDPLNFRRSVHATNRGGYVALDDGERFPTSRLPAPLMLCVPSGRGATFALHGWDNDDSGGLFANDFDDKDDDDELLLGVQRRFGAQLPTGVQVARSADLVVRYRVSRAPDDPRILPCPREVERTSSDG